MTNNKISRAFEARLRRQLEQYPNLDQQQPQSVAATQWRRFLSEVKGKPLFRFDLSESDHDKLMHETNSKCCMLDMVGRPLKNNLPSILFKYQMHVAHKVLWPTATEIDPTSFSNPDMIAKINDNVPTKDNINRSIAIAKSSGLGISYLCLLLGIYKCVVDDRLKNTQFCLVVGPSQNLAVLLLNRAKDILRQKLGLLFTSRETVMNINGVRWEVFPSFNLDSMRSLASPSFIYVSESSFVSNGREVLDICQRYTSKGNPIILWESTPARVGDVMDILFNHRDTMESQSFGTKILLPWTVGMPTPEEPNNIYDPTLITQQQATVGWKREFCVQWDGGSTGNVFTPQSIERAISDNYYSLEGIPAASKALGIDSSPGGNSAFAFTLLQTSQNKIQVLLTEKYEKEQIDFGKMVNRAIDIMKQYQNVRKIFVDSAIPTIWIQLKKLILERTDHNEYLKELEQWGYSEQSIQSKIRVWPISFNVNHRQLLANAKWILDCDPAILQINPEAHKDLVVALSSAASNEYDLIKKGGMAGSEGDILDSFLLACRMISIQQQPAPLVLQQNQQEQREELAKYGIR